MPMRSLLPLLVLLAASTSLALTQTGTGLSDAALAVLDPHLGLVGTLDGVLHAISLDDGRELWQFNTGSPLVSSANHQSVEKLIPSSLDGALFSFDSGRLERLGIDIQELVQRAPSINEEHAWTGAKTARMFLLDLDSGEVVRELASDFLAKDRQWPANTLLIGRADYTLQGTDRFSQTKEQLWNMSFSKYIAEGTMDPGDDSHALWLVADPASNAVEARAKTGGQVVWRRKFAAMPVNLFRVQRLRNSATVVQLNQFLLEDDRHSHLLLGGHAVLAPEAPLIGDGRGRLSRLLIGTTPLAVEPPPSPSPPPLELSPVRPSSAVLTGAGLLALVLVLGSTITIVLLLRRVTKKVSSLPPPLPPPPKKKNRKKELPPPLPTPARSLKISLTTRVLGYGSGGTVVYEGSLEGRRIAVKRMLKAFFDVAERETQILMRGDAHPNVVSYFLREEDAEFVYLALSYGCLTLTDLFGGERGDDGALAAAPATLDAEGAAAAERARAQPVAFLAGIVEGVAHLHSLGIVHRDLKPHNILIDPAGVAQISDMGLARKLEHLQHSFSTASSGTYGWQPPEVMSTTPAEARRVSMAVDVWGVGCLLYFTLSQGYHPFGGRLVREANIVRGRSDLRRVADNPLATHLIERCIAVDPDKRPTARQVRGHPFFWDAHRRLMFLMDVSDLLEALEGDVAETAAFERIHDTVLPRGMQWQARISPQLLENLGRYRRYTNSVKDLLRVVRNKSHHYRELPASLRAVLGNTHPEGFLDYFCNLFPSLFLCCYEYIAGSAHCHEATFRRYFQ